MADGVDIYLSEAALRATTDAFGAPQVVETIETSRLPADCELLYGTGAIPAWGLGRGQAASGEVLQLTGELLNAAHAMRVMV